MAIHPVADYVQNSGKVNIYVAFPIGYFTESVYPFSPARVGAPSKPATNVLSYSLLFKLGEATDEIDPQLVANMQAVPGDARGGRAGGGIEDMFIDETAEINLSMSQYDLEVYKMMETMGGLREGGRILPSNVGRLMRRDRSFRLLLVPVADTRFVMNFPCCLLKNRRGASRSSKWSELKLNISAHAAPLGHWGTQVEIESVGSSTDLVTYVLQNQDTIGIA